MSFLLDTHVLVWWMAAPDLLSQRVHDAIRASGSGLFVSVASVYEIEYKRDRDQLLYRLPKAIPQIVPMLGFEWLSLSASDAYDAARLGLGHRDPWDRIIAMQAKRRELQLITIDDALTRACADWDVRTIW